MLQQSDINALLTTLASSQEGGTGKAGREFDEVKRYDFACPDNLPSEFTRALEGINSSFARIFTSILMSYVSLDVHVESLSIDQLTYRQFCDSVPDITAVGVFAISPLNGLALIEVNPSIAWYVIDRGLGGQGEIPEKLHEFTPLEKGLLDDLFRRLLRELGKSWETLAPLRPALREVFSNPSVARIVQPDDRLVVCSFGITLPGVTGMSSYCLPVSNLDFERLLSGTEAWEGGADETTPEQDHESVRLGIAPAPLTLRACFRDTTVSLGELATLREGDIIHLDARPTEPLEVRVGNLMRFYAQPITVDDRVAVMLTDVWQKEEGL